MQSGGALVNQTIRLVVAAGAQVGATATVESGTVDGTGNVEVVVLGALEVVGAVVVVVVPEADFLLVLQGCWSKTTMPTMATASKANIPVRCLVVRRLRCFWMTACFWARKAR